jgi:hypothetical protein
MVEKCGAEVEIRDEICCIIRPRKRAQSSGFTVWYLPGPNPFSFESSSMSCCKTFIVCRSQFFGCGQRRRLAASRTNVANPRLERRRP